MHVTHIEQLFKAVEFAAIHHQYQRRSGYDRLPYINHLLKVVNILLKADEREETLLIAAVLHDVVEDTDVSVDEIAERFGEEVAHVVAEVTDDMTLPYETRKRHQVEQAPFLSERSKKIKIADKLCNIRDMLGYPVAWSAERKWQYILWSRQVVDQVRGVNVALELAFDEAVAQGLRQVKEDHETTEN